MAEMSVDIRVLVEDQKHWHPDKRVHKYWDDAKNKSGRVSQMKCVPDSLPHGIARKFRTRVIVSGFYFFLNTGSLPIP